MTNLIEVAVPSQGASGRSRISIIGKRSMVSEICRIPSVGGLFGTAVRAISAVKLTSVLFGLFVLAGVTTHAETAWAQENCPLAPGVTPPPEPKVTAQDVEDGSATLMEFARGATANFKSRGSETLTGAQLAFAGCRLRLEGGPWRSGSTYIVTLTLDGRVFLHAKDMSLSAGSLKSSVYAGILAALGVDRRVLADLASQDPAVRRQAQSSLRQQMLREPHGPFDLTGPAAGGRPGIPGASGYAAAYVSVNTEQPLVLLAGFDLDASHLMQESIDFGDPAITAREVVDRETLKAFVTEALRFLGGTLRNARTTAESRAAFAKARLALRDPNGPWRHGSVYLYVLDRNSNIILFHGAFPNRFELRPLVPTVRDVVTGKLVLPQVLEAASSSPEGGFVEYYFDDPSDDTDRADIPKLGYAREFNRTTTTSDGTEITTRLVIGSGVYLRAPETTATNQNTVITSVLPQMMRAMTASTVDAVSSRIRLAMSDAPPANEFSLAGASTLPDALLVNRQALEDGTLDLAQLLEGSSFVMPLSAADAGQRRNLTFWGSGDYRKFSGGSQQAVTYDGKVTSANLGFDTKLGANLLAGVALAQASGKAGYTDSNARSGTLTSTVTSVNPYMSWKASGGISLWAMTGYGSGEIEVNDSTAAQTSDLSWRMAAAGVNGPLLASDQLIARGTTNLTIKGETAFTRAGIDGSGTIESMTLKASRHRLMLEGSHVQDLASGVTFTPLIEFGLRSDGGDGETGTSVEAGGGLRYEDQAAGLTVEVRARTLLAHSGDYEEWGVSGLVKLDPGPAGVGLAFSVRPMWGQTASGVQQLWETGVTGGLTPIGQASERLDASVSYGMPVFGGRFLGTPELGLAHSEVGDEWRLGWKLARTASKRASLNLALGLDATRWEPATGAAPKQGFGLSGTVTW